jgi:hypothetical protein
MLRRHEAELVGRETELSLLLGAADAGVHGAALQGSATYAG